MKTLIRHSLFGLLLLLGLMLTSTAVGQVRGPQIVARSVRIKTTYDGQKDKTTVRLAPVRISGEKDKYHSLHFAPSFSYTGQTPQKPEVLDFELQTVVKTKLKVDLYVVFVVDGETIFLSSNRRGVRNPVPGKRWIGERLVFRMPYETLLKITKAQKVEIRMDAVRFEVGEPQLQTLRDFARRMEPES